MERRTLHEVAPGVFRDNVVPLVTESAVHQAWAAYADEAIKLAAQPDLLADREFNEKLTRLHERWKRLFLLQEAGQ